MPFPMFSGGGGEPGAPFGVSASNGGNVSAVVFFTPPDYLGKATVTYSVTSTPATSTQIFSASGQTFTGLTNGTSYTFVVRTLTDYSVYSEPSAASSAITPVAPPPSFGPVFPPDFPPVVNPCAGVTCGGSCDGSGGLVGGTGYTSTPTVDSSNPFGNCGGCASTSYNAYSKTCCESLACFTVCNGCAPPPCGTTGNPPGNGWTASGGLQFLSPSAGGAPCRYQNGDEYSVWQNYVATGCTDFNLFLNCSNATY